MDEFKLTIMTKRLNTVEKLPLDELDNYAIELNNAFYSIELADLLFARIAASNFKRTKAMLKFMHRYIDTQGLY